MTERWRWMINVRQMRTILKWPCEKESVFQFHQFYFSRSMEIMDKTNWFLPLIWASTRSMVELVLFNKQIELKNMNENPMWIMNRSNFAWRSFQNIGNWSIFEIIDGLFHRKHFSVPNGQVLFTFWVQDFFCRDYWKPIESTWNEERNGMYFSNFQYFYEEIGIFFRKNKLNFMFRCRCTLIIIINSSRRMY